MKYMSKREMAEQLAIIDTLVFVFVASTWGVYAIGSISFESALLVFVGLYLIAYGGL